VSGGNTEITAICKVYEVSEGQTTNHYSWSNCALFSGELNNGHYDDLLLAEEEQEKFYSVYFFIDNLSKDISSSTAALLFCQALSINVAVFPDV
jgi:hypothetical protein